jgi:hypothetical protein
VEESERREKELLERHWRRWRLDIKTELRYEYIMYVSLGWLQWVRTETSGIFPVSTVMDTRVA